MKALSTYPGEENTEFSNNRLLSYCRGVETLWPIGHYFEGWRIARDTLHEAWVTHEEKSRDLSSSKQFVSGTSSYGRLSQGGEVKGEATAGQKTSNSAHT